MLLVLGALTDCRGRWEWIEDAPVVRAAPVATCPGGRNDIERRSTRVIAGHVTTTVTRTNSCLE